MHTLSKPLLELPEYVAKLGYEYIELSPRADFLDWWVNPRTYPERTRAFKRALSDAGVKLASLLPMYRWASPHPVERLAAMRYVLSLYDYEDKDAELVGQPDPLILGPASQLFEHEEAAGRQFPPL